MEDLKRLVRIVVQKKQRQYPLLELKSINEHSSKENIFFRYLKKDIVVSDDEAAGLLYGTKADDDRYRMLKSRLKQKLLNHLFFLDFGDPSADAAQGMEQECLHYLTQAKMLQFVGEEKTSRSLVMKAYTLARRGELTKHELTSLEELVRIYSVNHQPHLFESTREEYLQLQKRHNIEEEARIQYLRMEMMLVKSVNSRKKSIDSAMSTAADLERLFKETKSFNVFEYFLHLKVLLHSLTGDFDALIPFLKEASAGTYKKIKLNDYRLDHRYITLALGHALMKTGKSREGLELLEGAVDVFDISTFEWPRYMEIRCLMHAKLKQHKQAEMLVEEVLSSRHFSRFDREEKDKWKLYNDYFRFARAGRFYNVKDERWFFLPEIPEYDKDKEGFLAAVMFLQFLYFVERGNYVELERRRDILREYMSNHFKENFSYRSRTFYKLLNIVVENNLELKQILNKSRYLTAKLPENLVMSDAFAELEIIPYEDLWEMLLDLIRQKDY